MKTIIAGSRTIRDMKLVVQAVRDSGFVISTVVSGAARGVDRLGEQFSFDKKLPLIRFHAEWDKYGIAAGHIRNEEMAKFAEALILVWDGKSSGSKNMLTTAKRYGLMIYEKVVQNES